ncbi:hypothetical protein FKM82_011276 [Ascaphus truei]
MDVHSIPLRMDLKISSIDCHPADFLVKFLGKYNAECEFDYHILQNEIQRVPKVNDNIGIGEFCLVQDKPFGAWHRGRILDKTNEIFVVCLIDQGNTVNVGSIQIASACGELFMLPPKIVKGIFSNILPIKEKWTPKEVNYFSSLVGLQIKGQVQTFLPHQVVLLEVPKIISHVVELNLAKYVDTDSFCLLIEISHRFPSSALCKQMPDLLLQKTLHSDHSFSLDGDLPSFQKILDHLRPSLSVGTTEKVKISAAVSPSRFYFHILSWEEELQSLTTTMFSHYEAIGKGHNAVLDNFGVLCAAKRKDGLWRRGVIQKILTGEEVKVWFIDFGSSETVSSSYVKKLQPEFLSLPMMAIPCSLSSINDHTESIRNMQLSVFKQGLLGQLVIAQVDQFCCEERLFYVTLYNQAYELNAKCHLTNEHVPIFSPNAYTNFSKSLESQTNSKNSTLFETAMLTEKKGLVENISYKTVEMEVDSVNVAYVEYVLNPSNFWIRTDEHQNEFLAMMENISNLYNLCGPNERVLENPELGKLCCALYAKDRHYYRAIVTEVLDSQIDVYFVDFGNTETVPFYDVKTLLPEFCVLPALAMCCTLAHVCPLDDVWGNSATDFFKQIVNEKALLFHVVSKQKYKYVVDVRHFEPSEHSNIVTLMVQAGYAEHWKIKHNACLPNVEGNTQVQNLKKRTTNKVANQNTSISLVEHGSKKSTVAANCILVSKQHVNPKVKTVLPTKVGHSTISKMPHSPYKQYMFRPGTVMDVICSHVKSPGDFWCQLNIKSSELKGLMEKIQNDYSTCNNIYQSGQSACIAKNPCDGKFYRAAIVNRVSRKEVDVIFVDYGNCERVLSTDLREIIPELLDLEGQAFRCSLNSLISPLNSNFSWTSDACRDFKCFFDSAATGTVKCTINSVFSVGYKDLYNAVNLETPFINACELLINKGHALFSHCSVPSICLYTFCYSNFNLEVGNEERVCVTYIYNPGKFYCQLAKNSEAVEALMEKVSEIGKKIKLDSSTKKKSTCVVKYFEDGNFYRALASPVESSAYFVTFFVDFGNSQLVEEDELLPIPDEATDVLCTPMQAIQCYLSDLKEGVFPTEVQKWFEETCIGKVLKAVIVTRDFDGQFGLELYDGDILINNKIKELLGMRSHSNQGEMLLKTKDVDKNSQQRKCKIKIMDPKDKVGIKLRTPKLWQAKNQSNVIPSRDHKAKLPLLPEKIISFNIGKPDVKIKDPSCKTSSQNHIHDLAQNAVQSNENCAAVSHFAMQSGMSGRTQIKCSDLPGALIEPSSSHLGYVSHIDSPSSFYIQLAENEEKITQLAEELNKEPISFQAFVDKDLKVGDLVIAEYAHDGAFYRAAVKQVKIDNFFEVEFIDYGNLAIVNSSTMFILPDTLSTIPILCIWVFLNGVSNLQTEGGWSKDVMSSFSEKVNEKLLNCEFLCMHSKQWEIRITCAGRSVTDELLQCFGTTGLQKTSFPGEKIALEYPLNSKPAQNQNSLLKSSNAIDHEKGKDVQNFPNDTNGYTHEIQRRWTSEPRRLESAKITYVSSCRKFFVTVGGYSVASEKLISLIETAVKQVDNRLALKNITKGMTCLAKSLKMQTWFRAAVEKIFPNERKMLVFFMDHGAHEIISMHNTKRLAGDILSIPKQAIACTWVGTEHFEETLFNKVMKSLIRKDVQIRFLHFSTSCNSWKVEVLSNDLLLKEYFDTMANQNNNEPSCTKIDSCYKFQADTEDFPKCSIPWAPLHNLKMYSGFLTAAYDPSDFYLQLDDSVDAMNSLLLYMNELSVDILPLPLELLRPGCVCLVKSFLEEEWCRSEIVKVTSDSILLTLLDYGLFKCIPHSDMSKLKIIPKDLALLPTLTYPCALSGVIPSVGTHWSKEAIDFFVHYVKHNFMFQSIKYNSSNKLEVNVYVEDNVSERLVSMGYAIYTEKASSKTVAVNTDATDMSNGSLKPHTQDETILKHVRNGKPQKEEWESQLGVNLDSAVQNTDFKTFLQKSDLQEHEAHSLPINCAQVEVAKIIIVPDPPFKEYSNSN